MPPTLHRRSALSTLGALLALPALPSWALYDPVPDAALAEVQGAWQGSLAYRDYSPPHGLVTLPARLFVALTGPQALALHFVYADGPTKTVFSYEQLRFDFAARQLAWASGPAGESVRTHAITARSQDGATTTLRLERQADGQATRHTLLLSASQLQLVHEELRPSGEASLRSRHALLRPA